jgi:hypothetical protein
MRLIFKSKQFSHAGNFEKFRWGKENDEENEERERLVLAKMSPVGKMLG